MLRKCVRFPNSDGIEPESWLIPKSLQSRIQKERNNGSESIGYLTISHHLHTYIDTNDVNLPICVGIEP